MTTPPKDPKIYHITHVDNLQGIIANNGLVSDNAIRASGGPVVSIGMGNIKDDRIDKRRVRCHPGTMVGDYVPFYFCPRSVMLFVIHKANHRNLAYRKGQGEIVHLEADLREVYRWARRNNRKWAISPGNAATKYMTFRNDNEVFQDLVWEDIETDAWEEPDIKDNKQAEYLMHESFPWELFSRIGVLSRPVAQRASDALQAATHRPTVQIMRNWYY